MKEEKPYREGDEENVLEFQGQDEKPDDPNKDQNQQNEEEVVQPITAFLVVQLPDGIVDVVTDIDVPRQRVPQMADVRNMCEQVASNLGIQLTAQACTQGIARGISQAAAKQRLSQHQAIIQPQFIRKG